jgi:hypothetical protein
MRKADVPKLDLKEKNIIGKNTNQNRTFAELVRRAIPKMAENFVSLLLGIDVSMT